MGEEDMVKRKTEAESEDRGRNTQLSEALGENRTPSEEESNPRHWTPRPPLAVVYTIAPSVSSTAVLRVGA